MAYSNNNNYIQSMFLARGGKKKGWVGGGGGGGVINCVYRHAVYSYIGILIKISLDWMIHCSVFEMQQNPS